MCIRGMMNTAHVSGFPTFGVGSAAISDRLLGVIVGFMGADS